MGNDGHGGHDTHDTHDTHDPASGRPGPEEMEPLAFEEALGRLDELVEVLEQGQIPLEEALTLYEEGILMAKRCQRLLDQAELRLQRLAPAPGVARDGTEAFVLESFKLDEDM
ncbi:MAG: exodeoxyribonuclease VII small subunit [Ktedonobacterales bacterium]